MRRKLRRKKILLIPLSICGVTCLIVWLTVNWKSRNQNFEAPIVPAHTERVRVSDVIAVNEFISASTNSHNRRLSDKIGAYRALPDTRDEACRARSYELPQRPRPKVSVIIAFHDEARSTLMRTVMAVWRRTPAAYLHELILLDDGSEDASLLATLRHLAVPPFARTFEPKNATARLLGPDFAVIKMQRNSRRLGLIESRNRGARLASGDFLFFLDSHCEVNVGWLEPLLARAALAGGAAVAVSPVLDSIDAETLQYRASSQLLVGGFDWNLHFHWVRRERPSDAAIDAKQAPTTFSSPVTSGGVFLISRKEFLKLKGFNTLLKIWGGESIEFSLKLWLCGGRIELATCSRVGHIFRKEHTFRFPNGSNGQTTYLRNSKIIAEYWLDSYKHFFYALKPMARNLKLNISRNEHELFKQQRKCKPFAWYLRNVFPQLKLPNDDFIAFGKLSTAERCLHIASPHQAAISAANLQMANCYHADVTRWYLHRHNGHLHSGSGACLNVIRTTMPHSSPTPFTFLNQTLYLDAVAARHFIVVLQYCHQTATTTSTTTSTVAQRWLRRGAQLIHGQTHLCLDNPLNDVVAVSHCRHEAPSQLFRFTMEMQQLRQL